MFDEETSVMMQEANLELSDRLSSGSHGSHRHRHERDAAIQPTKAKSDSSLSAISSKSIRRLSAFLPRSDSSRSASPHPTLAQADADPHGSGGDQGGSQAISAVYPPAETIPSITAATIAAIATAAGATCVTTAGDACDHAASQGGSSLARMRSPSVTNPKMLLSDLYKSTKSPLSRLRHHSNPAPIGADPDYDADLLSRDKVKQKAAIKRYLAERIRSDWAFKWPPSTAMPSPGEEHVAEEHVVGSVNDCAVVDTSSEEDSEDGDDDDDTVSTYSSVSEDFDHFRPRAEWLSDLSDEDAPTTKKTTSFSAYRFNSPETVATSVEASELERSAKRRKAVRDESHWNDGLACFTARRDAWTGAKTLRVRMKPESPAPPAATTSPPPPKPPPASAPSSKRLSWFRLSSSAPLPDLSGVAIPNSPTGTQVSGDTMVAAMSVPASPPSSSSSYGGSGESTRKEETQADSTRPVCHRQHKIETLLPIPAPLLPPANPMRASITPAMYPGMYDKIVTHSLTPSCPINLRDIIRACVSGWKRDGEWPPQPAEVVPVLTVRRKKKTSATATTRPRDGDRANRNERNTTRRMSRGFFWSKDTNVGAAAAAATGGSELTQTPTHTGSSSSGKGLRKNLQRVLGLGHDTVALG